MYKFKTLIFSSIFIANALCSYAQDPVKFHYNIKPALKNNGTLLEKDESKKDTVLVGFITQKTNPKDTMPMYKSVGHDDFKIRIPQQKIKVGKITINETHDTLEVSPWYPSNKAKRKFPFVKKTLPVKAFRDGSGTEVGINPESSYYFAIDWNKTTTKMGYKILRVPFTYGQFAVTSLPFRIGLDNDHEYKSAFLNLNIAYLFIYGKTSFYKSKFRDPKSNFWGVGPYVGASDVEEDGKTLFGFNYGVNFVRSIKNINLTLAVGAESPFSSKVDKFRPYAALGIGLKLIEFYEPENKAE